MMFVRTTDAVLRAALPARRRGGGILPGDHLLPEPVVSRRRCARASGARFMIAIPLSGALGGPLGGWLLALDGRGGLAGWQWLFLIEGLPSVLLGFVVLRVPDRTAGGSDVAAGGATRLADGSTRERSRDVGRAAWTSAAARARASAHLARGAS